MAGLQLGYVQVGFSVFHFPSQVDVPVLGSGVVIDRAPVIPSAMPVPGSVPSLGSSMSIPRPPGMLAGVLDSFL